MLRLVRSVGLVRAQGFAPSATAQRLLANKAGSKDELDDDSFELLPPGASMKDPLYGLSENQKLFHHDNKRVVSDKKAAENFTPLSRAAAQQKLEAVKKLQKEEENEDDKYVYLPPGSSMREPGDSMSDPGERKVYVRDPTPLRSPNKK